MDTEATKAQPVQLNNVRPGTRCRLVGILGVGPSRHIGRRMGRRHRMKGRGRRRHSPDIDCPFWALHDGPDRSLMRRLMDLGITRGCTFTVVQGGGSGPTLIEVRGTRIALGHRLACRILVEEVAANG
ncbi:MAG: ferrous iron transport protein A [Candidatus Thorarchaeota archaeon]|nr:ferrous iron transport protein A [Candidatus Thorarchaeota archaeon]